MTSQEIALARVGKAITSIKSGGMVIMVDDEDRENEGDLVFAATHVTPEKINFMTKEARGLICLSLEKAAIDRLQLPMMEDNGRRGPSKSTAFTVSIEASSGVSTGISAADRSHTVKVAANPNAQPDDVVVPGHIFPLKARSGGVLQRAGHTEGSIDLVKLAGFNPSAVICEIMNDDGTMARLPDLERFAAKHAIPIVTIADIVTFRLLHESFIELQASGPVKTAYGTFTGYLFKSQIDELSHMALTKGGGEDGRFATAIVDVRVHRQRPLADVFSDPSSGGRHRIEHGLKLLQDADAAVLIYLSHPEIQAGLADDFLTLLPKTGREERPKLDWLEPDSRLLGVGAQILRYLGVQRMRAHMAHPVPLKGLAGFGLEVVETVALRPNSGPS